VFVKYPQFVNDEHDRSSSQLFDAVRHDYVRMRMLFRSHVKHTVGTLTIL
jgi:hypothetical protein